MKSLSTTITVNTLALLAGRAISLACGGVTMMIVAGSLGVAGYGDFATIFSYLGILAIVNEFGLDQLYISFAGKKDEHGKIQMLANFFIIRLILATVFVLLVLALAIFFAKPQLKQGLVLASLIYVFTYQATAIMSYFQSKLLLVRNTIVDTCGKLVSLGVIAGLFFFSRVNLSTVILANVTGSAVVFFAMMTLLVLELKRQIRFKLSFSYLTHIFSSAFPLAFIAFLNQFFFRLDIPLLAYYRSGQETGLYAFAYKLFELSAYPGSFITASVYPLLSSVAQGAKFWKILSKSTCVITGISAVIGLVAIIFFPSLKYLAFVNKYISSYSYVIILFISLPFLSLQGLYASVFILKSRQKMLAAIYSLALALNALLNFVFIPIYGATAAAIITTFTQTAVTIFLMLKTR
ncbi:oligosaccharide flippase family protein [Candidatus Woesebacteria bacterium]|nr:oligosaccharide flippase family protein [Candidatus Woesebacteria bacterium]